MRQCRASHSSQEKDKIFLFLQRLFLWREDVSPLRGIFPDGGGARRCLCRCRCRVAAVAVHLRTPTDRRRRRAAQEVTR